MKMDIHVKAIEEGKEFKGGINKMPTTSPAIISPDKYCLLQLFTQVKNGNNLFTINYLVLAKIVTLFFEK